MSVRVAVLYALLVGACVDKAPEPAEVLSACVAVPDNAGTLSVVTVYGDLGDAGLSTCSGVAISPTLVLTGLECVVRAANADQTDLPSSEFATGQSGVVYSLVDDASLCARDAGWQPVENGTFAARLGTPLAPAALTVEINEPDQSERDFSVQSVIANTATSLCADDIALLVLTEPLDVPGASLRLEERTQVGDDVIASNYCFFNDDLPRRELRGQIEDSTGASPDENLPPRSLLLNRQVSIFASGGAVFAADTGALVGIIASGAGSSCDDTAGQTIVVKLAPFRRFLLDAATAAGQVLRVESALARPTDGQLRTCPDAPAPLPH